MKTLCELIHTLPATSFPNENLMYSFSDLKAILSMSQWIYVGNEYLTPFYVCNGKRAEFYYATLHIQPVGAYDFEGYLLQITGKKSISDIPEEVIALQKQCYIEVLQENPILSSNRILQYIQYILSMPDVIDTAFQAFSVYEPSKMMFTFFHS